MCENCNQPDYRDEYLRVQAELVDALEKIKQLRDGVAVMTHILSKPGCTG